MPTKRESNNCSLFEDDEPKEELGLGNVSKVESYKNYNESYKNDNESYKTYKQP